VVVAAAEVVNKEPTATIRKGGPSPSKKKTQQTNKKENEKTRGGKSTVP